MTAEQEKKLDEVLALARTLAVNLDLLTHEVKNLRGRVSLLESEPPEAEE